MLKVYSREDCKYCKIIKEKLDNSDFDYEIVDVTKDVSAVEFLKSEGFKTIPQIFLDGEYLGDCNKTIEVLSL